jgi:hypothetical protein
MSTDEPAPDGENTPAAPESATTSSGSGGVLDAAPITVLEAEPQTPEPIAAGAVEQPASPPAAQKNRRRRTGIAVATATGIVALAAAPFAMVAPTAAHAVGHRAGARRDREGETGDKGPR